MDCTPLTHTHTRGNCDTSHVEHFIITHKHIPCNFSYTKISKHSHSHPSGTSAWVCCSPDSSACDSGVPSCAGAERHSRPPFPHHPLHMDVSPHTAFPKLNPSSKTPPAQHWKHSLGWENVTSGCEQRPCWERKTRKQQDLCGGGREALASGTIWAPHTGLLRDWLAVPSSSHQ